MPAVLVTGLTIMQKLTMPSLLVAVTIASTHFTYPRRDGQAELTWVTGCVRTWLVYRPHMVTQPCTNPIVHSWGLKLQPVDHKSDALTTTLPNHQI